MILQVGHALTNGTPDLRIDPHLIGFLRVPGGASHNVPQSSPPESLGFPSRFWFCSAFLIGSLRVPGGDSPNHP